MQTSLRRGRIVLIGELKISLTGRVSLFVVVIYP